MTRQAYIESKINELRHDWTNIALGVGPPIILLLICLDYFVAPDQFKLFLIYRLMTATAMFAVFLFNRRKVSKNRHYLSITLGTFIVSAMVALMIRQLGGHESPYFAGFILILIIAVGFVPYSFGISAFLSLLIYAIYLIPILLYDTITNQPYFINSNFFIVSCSGLLILLRHQNHKRLLSEVGMQYDVNEQKEQLRIYSNHLEELVSDRTSELTSLVDKLKHEIAERKMITQFLSESEERFREIFEQNEDALLVLDPSNGKILDANPAAVNLFGCTQQDFIRKGLPLIFLQQDLDRFMHELSSMNSSGKLRIKQISSKERSGRQIIASIWGKAIQLKEKNMLFCSFRDITQRLRLEEESKFLQTKLIQMDKMASLGMLVSGIAHEINNPNHYISVNAQMVSEAWNDADKVLSDHCSERGDFSLGGIPFSEMRHIIPQLLIAMSEGSDRIRNIVESLKDFSKQSTTANNTAVDVNKIIAASTALLNSQIRKYTNCFHVNNGVDLPQVRGNKQQLEQVVINLIVNALQSLRDKSARVTVTSCFERETNNLLIQVRDEGIGMSKEMLRYITEPFYTTKIDEGGTGLGLSISASIIKDHCGSLTFESEPGRGTTATISLPAYQCVSERNKHAAGLVS